MNRSARLLVAFLAFILALGITAMAVGAYSLSGGDTGSGMVHRISTLLGGNFLGGGYIQFLTYFAFFWSLFEIVWRLNSISSEKRAFKDKLLPTNSKHLLLANDVQNLYFSIVDYEKGLPSPPLLSSIIKKACVKFRSSNSISEMIDIISIQTEINKEKSESDQSNIRYLTWVIPSIGFIGTVLGISQALMVANSGDMQIITATLGVAFDTTLISLILSIVVMWFFHNLQEETDKLHAGMKEYVIENLVNRIEL